MELKGKYAIITGGAGGIGEATASRFLKEGASGVLLVDLSKENLDKASKTLDDERIFTFAADVSKAEQVQAYTDFALEKFGRLDVVFLNAGFEGVVKPLTEYPEDIFDKVLAVNVKGIWLGMKYAFPHLQEKGGAVIITSSVAGLRGTAQMMAYTTSKHAIIGSMKVAALEGAPFNIRVNSIHPSPVDNRMMRSLEEGFAPGAGEEVKKGFEKMIPLGRYAHNDDIADLALFLASDRSKFITGSVHVIDGGFCI
ncbi:3-oxoacyl-[acyl-carrier protein] reductase [Indibacter alkaliphilus LW1]|jgi:NAD(P)-dependent dehydrogenase (short-subunit alcohol dehydrogenase family)|uniref:3-oxoacyl-[acyl-carrier protein] reductase n=1 Tax=Indibacter alkaliphilus (strain CCUG 57479 / KCTC 22604 / LW1) TaxID=1189612 RepID=S2D345_INDAL|nr:SDR family oxidoreductase [Indibacter alkaliphilus]EOZ93722.1 3-oxoacyl-[acyl-carrier protein] reductase [Indibacter alkaliphilus LW1]